MPGDSVEKTFTITNQLGLHLRAAGKLAQLAGKFPASTFITKDSVEVNGKSIMGILSLAAACGTMVTVKCSGPDCEKAMEAIDTLISGRFGEK